MVSWNIPRSVNRKLAYFMFYSVWFVTSSYKGNLLEVVVILLNAVGAKHSGFLETHMSMNDFTDKVLPFSAGTDYHDGKVLKECFYSGFFFLGEVDNGIGVAIFWKEKKLPLFFLPGIPFL